MVCFVCPIAAAVGGALGGLLGIQFPKETKWRAVSILSTVALTCISVIALKIIFNLSFCVGGTFTLKNFVRVSSLTFPLGIINFLLVNLLINGGEKKQAPSKKSCCHG